MTLTDARTRVLIVDDSPFMRHTIRKALADEDDLEVVGEGVDGLDGLEKATLLRPDVITLDIEMPRLDGLSMLRKLMDTQPTPVVILSTLAEEGAAPTLQALELGAIDFVQKPGSSSDSKLDSIRADLLKAIRGAAGARVQLHSACPATKANDAKRGAAKPSRRDDKRPIDRLVIIGSSTGGPAALPAVMSRLDPDLDAPVLLIQHMPPGFTASLAERLNRDCPLTVSEARDGEPLTRGHVHVAAGGRHMITKGQRIRLVDAPTVHGVRPAIDYTLESIDPRIAATSVIAILTGIGKDGAYGSKRLRALGCGVVAQDEATSTVYGMPRAVAELGATDRVVSLDRVADEIGLLLRSRGGPSMMSGDRSAQGARKMQGSAA